MTKNLNADIAIAIDLSKIEQDHHNGKMWGGLIKKIRRTAEDSAEVSGTKQMTIQKLVGLCLGTDDERLFLYARSALLAHIKTPQDSGAFKAIVTEVDFLRSILVRPSQKQDTIKRFDENIAIIRLSTNALTVKESLRSWQRAVQKKTALTY